MKSFLSFYAIFVIPFLAYGSAWLLNRAIEWGYIKSKAELEYPKRLSRRQSRKRLLILTAGLIVPYVMAFIKATSWTSLFILLLFMAILTAITVMDFEQQIILDEFILALTGAAILSLIVLPVPVLYHVLAGLVCFGLFMLFAVITHGGIGGGDIKLLGALGLFLGMERIIFTVVCGIIAGGIVSLVLLISKQKRRKDAIAYGPYFAIAAMLSLFWA